MTLDHVNIFLHEGLPSHGVGDFRPSQVFMGDVVFVENVERKVHPAALEVLVHIPKDIDELHLDAQVHGMQTSSSIVITVDFDEDQADG